MRVKVKNVLVVTAVVCFLPIIWISLTAQNGRSQYEEVLEKRFADLRDRLQYADSLNRQREHDLYILRSQFNYVLNSLLQSNATNRSSLDAVMPGMQSYLRGLESMSSQGSIHLPSIFTYLPHLVGHPERMRPAYQLSQRRNGVSIAIGVPTIKRQKASYLVQTLRSLVDELNPEEKDDCLIVVFIAEPWDQAYVEEVGNTIKDNFAEHLDSGLMEVIAPPAGYYPDLNHLKETFGDSSERVKWRTKQNLDYCFLMLYARSRSVYYVQLEDDVIAKPGYLSIMKTFAYQQKSEEWLLLEFSSLGFIGKLFKSSDLPMVVEFFLMFHTDKPVDWLLDHLLIVKVCNPEKDAKHCGRMKQAVRVRFKPSLFQHIGITSSLKGKVQKLKDKDFGKQGLARAHVNPPVQISSSLKTYQKYSLVKAYVGETFFWATTPAAGDIVDFKFIPPITLTSILFRSGNSDHPDDRFYDTDVEVLPETMPSQLPSEVVALNPGGTQQGGYLVVGSFDNQGIAQASIPAELGTILVVRLHVRSNSNNWVILSEIHFKTR